MSKPSITVNGVNIYPFSSKEELVTYVLEHQGILVAVNAEKILHATEQTRGIINRNIGYCDGWGAVAALKRKGCRDVLKIAGCELWLDIIAATYTHKTFYLVGGRPEIIRETLEKLKQDFPGIRIVNYRDGYIRSDREREDLLADIKAKKPDIVFVAMGSPKQELLMEEMFERHSAIYQGLGGSFDVYTGHVARAPKWWVRHHLEWAYRLLRQPSRIWRQIHLVRFLFLLIFNKL